MGPFLHPSPSSPQQCSITQDKLERKSQPGSSLQASIACWVSLVASPPEPAKTLESLLDQPHYVFDTPATGLWSNLCLCAATLSPHPSPTYNSFLCAGSFSSIVSSSFYRATYHEPGIACCPSQTLIRSGLSLTPLYR